MNVFIAFIILQLFTSINSVKEEKKPKSWKEKNIMDMNDADMERLLDQWNEDEEPLPEDELPEHLRPPRNIDLSKIDTSDPDNLLKATKAGKSLMMFVDVQKDLDDARAESILRLWQGSLQNNHLIAERYPLESKRAIFMFKDGSQAVEAKNFLIQQPELDLITLEGHTYYGKYSKSEKLKSEL